MLSEKFDLTTRQLNRLKKNKATLIKPTQISENGIVIELSKKKHKKMKRNFSKGQGFILGGEIKKEDDVYNIISKIDENIKQKKGKNPTLRKELSFHLSNLIAKAVLKSQCARKLICFAVASDIVDKIGTEIGFGLMDELKIKAIKPLVRDALRYIFIELSNDPRINPEICVNELTDPVCETLISVSKKLNKISTWDKLKYSWKIATNFKGEKIKDLRDILIKEIGDLLFDLMGKSECFQLIISIAVSNDIVDKIANYIGGFGLVEDLKKEALTKMVRSIIDEMFSSLVKLADIDISKDVLDTCAEELTGLIVNFIIEDLEGNIEKIPEFLSEQFQKFKDLLNSLKRKPGLLPPKAREFVKEYGETEITQVQVFYYPIENEDWINYATLGSFKEAKKKMGYENMYHLGLLFNGDITYHKTEIILLHSGLPVRKDATFVNVPIKEPIILGAFIDNQLKYMGDDDFSNYTASTLNCQDFVKRGLEANGISISPIKDILQDVKGVFDLMPEYVEGVSDIITDVASVINRQVEGEGMKKKKKRNIKVKINKKYL